MELTSLVTEPPARLTGLQILTLAQLSVLTVFCDKFFSYFYNKVRGIIAVQHEEYQFFFLNAVDNNKKTAKVGEILFNVSFELQSIR